LTKADAGRGLGRTAADHPRRGAAQAQYQAEHQPNAAQHRGQSANRARSAVDAGSRRVGLDRDEGLGEGPQSSLRDGNGFALDIQRYLDDEAVLPVRPVPAYRFRKFARRHKALLATTALVTTALVLGLIGTSWQAVRALRAESAALVEKDVKELALHAEEIQREIAEQARQESQKAAEDARREAAVSQALNEFLIQDLLGMADAAKQVEGRLSADPDVRLSTLLDRAANLSESRFIENPEVQATVHFTIAEAYRSTGQYEKAIQFYRRCFEQRTELFGDQHPDTFTAMRGLANALRDAGDYQQSLSMRQRTIPLAETLFGAEHELVLGELSSLGILFQDLGRFGEAREATTRAWQLAGSLLGPEHPTSRQSLGNLARLAGQLGDYSQAKELSDQHYELTELAQGPDHPDSIRSLGNRGLAELFLGDYQAALLSYQEAVKRAKQVLGSGHPSTLLLMNQLANVYQRLDRNDDAFDMHQQTYTGRLELLGPRHPDTLQSMHNMGLMHAVLGQYDQAQPILEQNLQLYRETLGDEHPTTLYPMATLARVMGMNGQFEASLALNHQILEHRRKLLGENHPDTLAATLAVAEIHYQLRRYPQAAEQLQDLWQRISQSLGQRHPQTLYVLEHWATALYASAHYSDARERFEEVIEISRHIKGESHPDVFSHRQNRIAVLSRLGQHSEVLQDARQLMEDAVAEFGETHEMALACHFALATSQLRADDLSAAEASLTAILSQLRQLGALQSENGAEVAGSLAAMYLTSGDITSAKAILEEVRDTAWNRQSDAWPWAKILSLYGDCLSQIGDIKQAESMLVGGFEALSQSSHDLHDPERSEELHQAARRLAEHFSRTDNVLERDRWRDIQRGLLSEAGRKQNDPSDFAQSREANSSPPLSVVKNGRSGQAAWQAIWCPFLLCVADKRFVERDYV
jgi:tetratricopeptide (TPR) repeat protein